MAAPTTPATKTASMIPNPSLSRRFASNAGRLLAIAIAGYYAIGLLLVT